MFARDYFQKEQAVKYIVYGKAPLKSVVVAIDKDGRRCKQKHTMPITELSGGQKETSRTYVFEGEGHTLGNALRGVVSRYPDVTFCGYTVPHPSENKMNFRIQTSGTPAIDVLQRGLSDLEEHCAYIATVFEKEVETYKKKITQDAKTIH